MTLSNLTEGNPGNARANPANRSAQLDALRALAIGIVLIHHYRDTRFFLSGFGATLFFVLSGFFATKTLLKLKRGVEGGHVQAEHALKTFYFNRWLRLWPLYYLLLALTWLLDVENARSSFLWNATFTSNMNVLLSDSWSGRFSPLWSLSVLEQFYLFWPVVILTCPRTLLLPLILGVVACAPLFRLGCYLTGAPPLYWCVVPFASFDQLGCGALLALCVEKVVSPATANAILRIAGKFFVPIFLLLLCCQGFNIKAPFESIYIGTIASIAFLWLTHRVAGGIGGRVGRLMGHPLLSHIGKLSYSIFLLHDFTELLIPKNAFTDPLLKSDAKALILIPLTVLVAHFAWLAIEVPMMAFRKKFVPSPSIPV